jgi:hypothetical protein
MTAGDVGGIFRKPQISAKRLTMVGGREAQLFLAGHYVERFQLMDFNFDGALTLDEFINGRLLNT